jgi:hypothetical protein
MHKSLVQACENIAHKMWADQQSKIADEFSAQST